MRAQARQLSCTFTGKIAKVTIDLTPMAPSDQAAAAKAAAETELKEAASK